MIYVLDLNLIPYGIEHFIKIAHCEYWYIDRSSETIDLVWKYFTDHYKNSLVTVKSDPFFTFHFSQ